MTKPITILVADDDADDRMLIKDAFEEARLNNEIHFVEDGEQLLGYLRREGEFSNMAGEAYPGIILLDLNPALSSWTSICPARTAAKRCARSRPTRS